MYYVGIDLHKRFLVIAVEGERGPKGIPKTFNCHETVKILRHFEKLKPFKAVIEASASYRWLHELLSPYGEIILAHPLKLRAIVSGRAKTDKLDAKLLAKLLRVGLIPRAYIPPARYQLLRDITRGRAKLVRDAVRVKNELQHLMMRRNLRSPYKVALCDKGRAWLAEVDMGTYDNIVRDELLRRLAYYQREVESLDGHLEKVAADYPEVESLLDICGIGLYSALLIVGEIGEVHRFAHGKLVGCYAGLTARVHQSGSHEYYGHISKQGSSWLRWILVQAAMKVVRRDRKLKNFHERIRKRSSAKIARVAVARKLACICWVRLKCWHKANRQAA